MSDADIRSDIKSEMETISGLGGPNNENVHDYWVDAESDDQFRTFYVVEESDGTTRLHYLMMQRTNRRHQEIRPGVRMARINRYLLRYRLSSEAANSHEKEFQGFVEDILNKFEGNETIFNRKVIKADGTTGSEKLHPQEVGLDQAAGDAEMLLEEIQETNVWRADIPVQVPEFVNL